jgi:hypothetical protein
MSVPRGLEANHVLVSLDKSFESESELVEAHMGWDMRDNMCESPIFLELCQLVFKPLELVTWIIPVVQQPPVKVVACLHIKTNHLALWVELKWLCVVSVLLKDLDLVEGEPCRRSPTLFEMIYCPIALWS